MSATTSDVKETTADAGEKPHAGAAGTPDEAPSDERRESRPGTNGSGKTFARWKRRLRLARTERIDYDRLRHFAASVESELDLLCAMDRGTREKPTVALIRQKLGEISPTSAAEVNWSRAYHAEKLLVALLSDDRVHIELPRRLDRLERTDAPFTSFYKGVLAEIEGRREENALRSAAARRDLLMSMIDDTQAHNCKRYIKMRYARTAIYKIGSAFVGAFIIFLVVLTWGHWEPSMAERAAAPEAADVSEDERP